jgi:uncharacterized membrane protein
MRQTLWEQLQQKDLISGDYQTTENISSPWFIKLLLAFSGWFASLFIFAFFIFLLHDAFDNSLICLVIGLGLITFSYFVLKNKPHDFLEHLMLSTSLAGQALIALALFANELLPSDLLTWLTILAMQCSLAIIMPHYVHRVCSAFFASLAFILCCHYLHITMISSASLLLMFIILSLNEWRFVKFQPAIEAIGYGILLLLIPFKASTSLEYQLSYWLNESQNTQGINQYMDELLLIFTMLYLLITLLQRSKQYFSLKKRIVIILVTVVFCLLSLKASGITVGLAILIVGFSNSNKIQQGLGICALLYFVGSYYYLLEQTLFDKSVSLLVISAFLLLMRYLLLTFANPLKKGENNEA